MVEVKQSLEEEKSTVLAECLRREAEYQKQLGDVRVQLTNEQNRLQLDRLRIEQEKANDGLMRVSEQLEYGIVCSNSGVFSTEVAPFGGWKQSGIGSEGGREGIQDFYETKFHSMGGID